MILEQQENGAQKNGGDEMWQRDEMWQQYGGGGYNTVLRSLDGRTILKIPRSIADITDRPDRSVRLWRQINPHLSPVRVIQKKKGWICPYVEGVQASDTEMSSAVIEIFNRTGRIVVDAPTSGNFKKTLKGTIECVDIGWALQLEKRETVRVGDKIRRKSIVSLTAWKEYELEYDIYFAQTKVLRPKTTATIQALLLIKLNRPDLFDVSFLINSTFIFKFACAYGASKVPVKPVSSTAESSSSSTSFFFTGATTLTQPGTVTPPTAIFSSKPADEVAPHLARPLTLSLTNIGQQEVKAVPHRSGPILFSHFTASSSATSRPSIAPQTTVFGLTPTFFGVKSTVHRQTTGPILFKHLPSVTSSSELDSKAQQKT